MGYKNCIESGRGRWDTELNVCACTKGWKTDINQDVLAIPPANYTWCSVPDLDVTGTEAPFVKDIEGALAFLLSLWKALLGDRPLSQRDERSGGDI